MSYAGISVREALDKLNAPNNGWYLPQVQRQYVWGARHESEDYVCLLLDSLLKRYPIGGVVLWETEQKVPYRCFVDVYQRGALAELAGICVMPWLLYCATRLQARRAGAWGGYALSVAALLYSHLPAAVMVIGSFTSASLDPPLVAFFPDRASSSWPKI